MKMMQTNLRGCWGVELLWLLLVVYTNCQILYASVSKSVGWLFLMTLSTIIITSISHVFNSAKCMKIAHQNALTWFKHKKVELFPNSLIINVNKNSLNMIFHCWHHYTDINLHWFQSECLDQYVPPIWIYPRKSVHFNHTVLYRTKH